MPEKVVVKRCDPGKYQKKTRIYFSVEFTALLMNLTNVLKKTRRQSTSRLVYWRMVIKNLKNPQMYINLALQ